MELSSSELICALAEAYADAVRVLPRCGPQNAARPASKGSRIRCRLGRCGQCPQCLEDARWERIFAEKFADPDYYTGCITHGASPLASF
jgi:hypothetical protein